MRICMPTETSAKKPSETPVHGHFGSAPCFVIYDTDRNAFEIVENAGKEHEHGKCNPFHSLQLHSVDALVTGGIGQRALTLLREHNIKVYRATEGRTAIEVIQSFQGGKLKEISLDDACAHHGGH